MPPEIFSKPKLDQKHIAHPYREPFSLHNHIHIFDHGYHNTHSNRNDVERHDIPSRPHLPGMKVLIQSDIYVDQNEYDIQSRPHDQLPEITRFHSRDISLSKNAYQIHGTGSAYEHTLPPIHALSTEHASSSPPSIQNQLRPATISHFTAFPLTESSRDHDRPHLGKYNDERHKLRVSSLDRRQKRTTIQKRIPLVDLLTAIDLDYHMATCYRDQMAKKLSLMAKAKMQKCSSPQDIMAFSSGSSMSLDANPPTPPTTPPKTWPSSPPGNPLYNISPATNTTTETVLLPFPPHQVYYTFADPLCIQRHMDMARFLGSTDFTQGTPTVSSSSSLLTRVPPVK